MLLVIDIGNTNIVMGVYDGTVLLKDWRICTEKNITQDKFNLMLSSLFAEGGIKPDEIDKTIISSVVTSMADILDAFCRKYLGHTPYWVDAKSPTGMPILYTDPTEVGADRIVNAVAAFHKYKTSLIVVDFGTATTFDAVSAKGEYLGGAISPGIMISAEALFKKASRLPAVEILRPPEMVIGKNTSDSMKSGIIYGHAGIVDGIVRRIKKEMETSPKIIATGGLSKIMTEICESIDLADNFLTLEGLRIIYDKLKNLQ